MFFKKRHLLTELRKSGRRATAEIVSIKTVGEGSSLRARWAPDEDLGNGWVDREKAHCAKRGYARLLMAPRANEPDVHQVSQQDRRDLRLAFAADPAEAIDTALAPHHEASVARAC